ncbi:MAG: diaminopimelate decarboxylase family protein, partial [Chloroflexota bacterium]
MTGLAAERGESARPPATTAAPDWWHRPGLESRDGQLLVAGEDAARLARAHGTPLFVYDRARLGENARRLQSALSRAGLAHRVRFALKANPLPEVLEVLRRLGPAGSPGAIGIDACSPGEITRAMECGWEAGEISYTGTNVSERDLDVILATGVHVNLDAISQVERYGRRAAGTRIGLRIDPAAGAGYHAGLAYSGERPHKFGIGLERLDDAIAAAERHGLVIDTVHFHAGSGWLGDGLADFETALLPALDAVNRLRSSGHPVEEVNVGGGLGTPA